MEITKDKITEIFCIIDDFCQEYDKEIARMSICEPDGRKHRNRKSGIARKTTVAYPKLRLLGSRYLSQGRAPRPSARYVRIYYFNVIRLWQALHSYVK